MTHDSRLLVLMGPTAAGKTALALELARRFSGEIINADARQIYAGMDIGTDKRGSRQETVGGRSEPLLIEEIPHYLIDILTPDQHYSAAEFRTDALYIVEQIQGRGKLSLVVGGTGFYLRVLTGDRPLPNVPPDPVFRDWAETQAVESLAEELRQRASDLFAKVDQLRNRRRVTRYLEIARARGSGEWGVGSGERVPEVTASPTPYSLLPTPRKVLKLALIPPKAQILQRIEERVDAQLRDGLIDEVRRLVSRYGEDAPGLQAVGYRQVFPLLRGEATVKQTRESIIWANRDYLRRQLAWLTTEPRLVRVPSSAEALQVVSRWLQ